MADGGPPMKRVFAIARLNLLSLFRDRTELVAVIVLPLLLTWVFGTAFGSQGAERPLGVPVVDLDRTEYSRTVVKAVDDAPSFEADTSLTKAAARAAVKAGDAPVIVVIPKGFGAAVASDEPARVETLRDPSSQRAQALVEVVQGAATRIATNAMAARAAQDAAAMVSSSATLPAGQAPGALPVGHPPRDPALFARYYGIADSLWEPAPPVSVTAVTVTSSAAREAELSAPANTQYSLGFTVFFVFMTALGSAGGILEERELGTLRRLLATPVRRAEVLGGKVMGVALVASFEAAMLVGFGALVFGVPWGSDPLAVAAVLLGLVLAATGLGVMLSALVRTRSQMSAIAPVLSTALAMLGGCYWPLEITSPTMQTIAKFTPTGWAMVGLKDVVARGAGLEAVMLPVVVLLAFSAVSLAVGVTRLKLE